MIQKTRDYEKIFLDSQIHSKSTKKISTTFLILMVLLTAFGVSIFTFFRLFLTQPLNMVFLSQTFYPPNGSFVIAISVVVPEDLIENQKFVDTLCDDLKSEIEDGYVRISDGEILVDLLQTKIESEGRSIGIYYEVKFLVGKLEKTQDLALAVYNGWNHFEPDYFKLIQKFRLKEPIESDKYEILRSLEDDYENENDSDVRFEKIEINISNSENVVESNEEYENKQI